MIYIAEALLFNVALRTHTVYYARCSQIVIMPWYKYCINIIICVNIKETAIVLQVVPTLFISSVST